MVSGMSTVANASGRVCAAAECATGESALTGGAEMVRVGAVGADICRLAGAGLTTLARGLLLVIGRFHVGGLGIRVMLGCVACAAGAAVAGPSGRVSVVSSAGYVV